MQRKVNWRMMNDVKMVKTKRPGIATHLWLLFRNGWLFPEAIES